MPLAVQLPPLGREQDLDPLAPLHQVNRPDGFLQRQSVRDQCLQGKGPTRQDVVTPVPHLGVIGPDAGQGDFTIRFGGRS